MIRYITLLLTATLIFLSGCTEEVVESIGKNNGQSISFEFFVPDATETTRATPVLTNESAIDDVYVFVFESGTNQLDQWVKASITTSANITTGTVTLNGVTHPASQHKLVFLANVEDEILSAAGSSIIIGMTYSAFASVLSTGITSIQTTGPAASFRFPMWGESGAVTLSGALDFTGSNAIQMLRSLAKIDVGVNLQSNGTATGLTEFKLTGITVSGVNNSALVIPALANIGSDGYVAGPTVAGSAIDVERTVADGQYGSLSSIYVPETYNNATTAEAARPYVILKGIYLGIDPANTIETFYRLDFVTGPDREPVDLMRNYSYTFNITEVHRAGYATLQDAINKLPVGLSYDFFPSNTAIQYLHFCYNDVGYLAAPSDVVTIVSHLAGVSVSQTYKAEYMGNTTPAMETCICDVNGNEITPGHFTVSMSSANTVRVVATAANDTYEFKTGYFKVYLADNPDIYLVSEVRQNIFGLANVTQRYVFYGRTASSTDRDGTGVISTATYPHLPNSNEYFAIYWSGSSYSPLPASKFRITRGSPSDSFYYQIEVNHPAGPLGSTDNFLMPLNSSPNYVEWNIEWWNPYENGGTGGWVEFATEFEQVGSNFRHTADKKTYFAVTDMEYGSGGGYAPGSGVYTGWNWTGAMGIDPIYQTQSFSTTGGYTPTETTGCGAYWEGSPGDPVTGQGQWELPSSGLVYFSTARNLYFYEGSYLGIPAGAVDTSSTTYYISSTNSTSTFTANSISGSASTNKNTQKTDGTDYRVRCIRRIN
ncbi:MAG: fimbrial protein [Tannerellaceae bacterium]|nr:fimbrial protein [Tannerellaceae bacterium]